MLLFERDSGATSSSMLDGEKAGHSPPLLLSHSSQDRRGDLPLNYLQKERNITSLGRCLDYVSADFRDPYPGSSLVPAHQVGRLGLDSDALITWDSRIPSFTRFSPECPGLRGVARPLSRNALASHYSRNYIFNVFDCVIQKRHRFV